ncbi:MAG: hypothetical protein ACJ76W_08160 [Chloroflexota bacterium]
MIRQVSWSEVSVKAVAARLHDADGAVLDARRVDERRVRANDLVERAEQAVVTSRGARLDKAPG